MANQISSVLSEMSAFYDEMAAFQAEAMVGKCPMVFMFSLIRALTCSKLTNACVGRHMGHISSI